MGSVQMKKFIYIFLPLNILFWEKIDHNLQTHQRIDTFDISRKLVLQKVMKDDDKLSTNGLFEVKRGQLFLWVIYSSTGSEIFYYMCLSIFD